MRNAKKVIFVQGFGDYTDGVWPNWLARQLTICGFDFDYLDMPDVMCPEVHDWVDFLKKKKITINKNTIPFDPNLPFDPSGIRMGTPAITTRGMKEKEMKRIAGWINEVISDSKSIPKVRKEIKSFCKKFPLPK